MNKMMLNYW